MPRVSDKGQLEKINRALSKWEEPRGINWLSHAKEEILKALQSESVSLSEINEYLYLHSKDEMDINCVKEKEPSLKKMGKDCFYEFRMVVREINVYVKARFVGKDFYVVSAHKGHDHG